MFKHVHCFVTSLSWFYYVQDAKSTHRNNIGGVIHHYILMLGKKYKVVICEVKMPDLKWLRAILVGMLWLGSAAAVVLAWPVSQCWHAVAPGSSGDGDAVTANPITSAAVSAQQCESRTGCSDQVENHCIKAPFLKNHFLSDLKSLVMGNANFLPEFDWLQHAGNSGGCLAFGTQLE